MGKKVWGISPRDLRHDVLNEELTRLGLLSTGSQDTRVERMATWIDQNCDPDELVDCDCGGYSDTTHFLRCPFCGDAEVELDDGRTIEGTQLAFELERLPTNFDGMKTFETGFAQVEVLTEASLDDTVEAIRKLKNEMAKNYHRLGVMLRDVHVRGLWRMRQTKDGKPKYAEFGQWTRAEAGLGRTQAMKCVEVATHFSEKEVKEIGHTRLAVALQVPPEYRDRLVDQARQGASKRDLERAVAVVKGRPEPVDRLPPANSITLAMAATDRTIELMADDDSGDRAFCIGDNPVGEEVLSNDVAIRYRVLEDTDGSLILRITRKRLD